MDMELSRLAAKALSSPYMTDELSFDERQAFVHAVRQAKDKDSLPQDVADLLAKALASIPEKKQ